MDGNGRTLPSEAKPIALNSRQMDNVVLRTEGRVATVN
jgi:hypothetical protein